MRKLFISFVCAGALGASLTGKLHATGGFSPDRWLDNGGIASDMSPEFFWELEIKRMARKYTPSEKRDEAAEPAGGPSLATRAGNINSQVDAAEFDDAIKTGRIKPPDPEKAKEAHKLTRELGAGGFELGDEFASEFADYHRGAFAFRHGSEHFDEARTAWEKLLQRPEAERHYRSGWAAFMLGKLAQVMGDHPKAVKWFRQTRELAGKGFADALGLAADSYGWEGRSELRQRHFEAAAKLYLTQLALGDESAIVSLKAVIPDRPDVDGTISYGDPVPDNATPEEIKKREEAQEPLVQQRLDECARSPVLRPLVTAHVLATETQEELWSEGGGYGAGSPADGAPQPSARCLRWLATVEKAGLKQLDDADHLGWVAYTGGRYKEAARWLAMAKPTTPTALWLKAKLERRDGKIAQATATMAEAFKAIRADVIPRGESMFTYGEPGYQPEQSAAGDLAALHLTRGEFVDTMDSFLQGNLWSDAAFIGDRVLTVDELKKYVDAHYPKAAAEPKNPDDATPQDNGSRLRWMLARRLVRANRFDEARPYFQKKELSNLGRYVAALKDGDNSKLPKMKRARALFTAAWIARHDGMEIMGTKAEPDGFENEGEYPPGNLDTERVEGVRVTMDDDTKKKKRTKLSIPPSAAEKQRITANSPHPTKRYHYRWVAADLAWRAAGLMNDGTEELADVLNTGGAWIKDHDDKGADKFIQAIERRCPHTEIGKAESVKHWFADSSGPWSDELDKEETAAQPDATKPQ